MKMYIVERICEWIIYVTDSGNYTAINPDTHESLTHSDKDYVISMVKLICRREGAKV